MRHYDTSCGPMSCVPTRKDGVPEFVIKLLYCRAVAGADTGGGGYGGSSPPPSRKWAGLQCAHAQRHVITIGLYTLNRCFWRVFRAATDQGRI